MKSSKEYCPRYVRLLKLSVLTCALTAAVGIGAQPVEVRGPHRKPPQEALDACKNASSGQDCSFTSPHGAVKGSCWAPEGKPLACKPKDGAGRPAKPKS
ncbi:MAG: hypothetical protein H7293_08930 [Candidatus Saccharibacteria bacterium]|nr:hypothetical protein [Rhodoferax sp.]